MPGNLSDPSASERTGAGTRFTIQQLVTSGRPLAARSVYMIDWMMSLDLAYHYSGAVSFGHRASVIIGDVDELGSRGKTFPTIERL